MNAKQYIKKENNIFYTVFIDGNMTSFRIKQLFNMIEGYADYKRALIKKRDIRNDIKALSL